jgi:hypothetical protein
MSVQTGFSSAQHLLGNIRTQATTGDRAGNIWSCEVISEGVVRLEKPEELAIERNSKTKTSFGIRLRQTDRTRETFERYCILLSATTNLGNLNLSIAPIL